MARKRLFIHSGPPKTASRSFQILLGGLVFSNTIFIGIHQPRKEKRAEGLNNLASKILRYIKGGNEENARQEIRRSIQLLFEQYDNIIYSEEIILHKDDWKTGIKHLFDLFGDLDVSFAYCLRDARKVVPSYYCESYGYLEESYQDDFQMFLRSQWISIYDLSIVMNEFRREGGAKVTCFDFDQFVAGKLSLNQIFDADIQDPAWLEPLKPPLTNKKSIDTNGSRENGELRYTVFIDKYKYLSPAFRKLLGKLKSIGLGGITRFVKKRMIKKRELVIQPSPLLEDLYHKNLISKENL